MDNLSDEQLCILNSVVYNKHVYDSLTSACASGQTPTLREVIDSAGETYYDAMEWDMSMDRTDWYDLVQAVDKPGALGDLRVVDVGSLDANGATFCDGNGTPYAVFRGASANDHGSDVDWFAGSEAALVSQGRAYVDYIRNYTGAQDVVVSGHAEGGARALAATLTGTGVSRCVTFDARGLSATFPHVWKTQIEHASTYMRNYYTAGDIASPHIATIVGENIAIKPTRVGAGSVKDHALISLLDTNLAFGEQALYARGEGAALDALSAWFAEMEERPNAAGASAVVADVFSDFIAWLDTSATDAEKKKLNPFINELLDATASGKPRQLSEVFSRNTATAGLFLFFLAQFPGIRGEAAVGLFSFLFASKATDGESDHIAETILSMLHLSKRARSSIKSTFTRHVRNHFEEGHQATYAQVMDAAVVHDFGDDCLGELLSIVAEIESEPFYDVTRWDLWYHIEQSLGLLTMQRYQDDIRTYQRKILDLTDTSAADIRQRFTRARELDAGFARQMRVASEALQAAGEKFDQFEYRL